MSGDFFVRAATAADQKTIRAMINEAGINPLGLHWPNFLLAQHFSGAIVGVGQVKQHRDGSRELASIATAPDYQRGGVASTLIGELLRREAGVLYLYCEGRNRGFYPRFGFYEIDGRLLPPSLRTMFRVGDAMARFISGISSRRMSIVAMRRDASTTA